jgi:hypothetical protein
VTCNGCMAPRDDSAVDSVKQGKRAHEHALARAGRTGDHDAVALTQAEVGGRQQGPAALGAAPCDAGCGEKHVVGEEHGIRCSKVTDGIVGEIAEQQPAEALLRRADGRNQ